MTDFRALRAEWEDVLRQRGGLGDAVEFWTPVLDGWAAWQAGFPQALEWTAQECRARWERATPLLAEAPLPDLAPAAIEALLGPMVERLGAAGPEEAAAIRRFVEAWDRAEVGPWSLSPLPGKDGGAGLQERLGLGPHLVGFLAQAGLRPPLEAMFSAVRALPEGLWSPGTCPWCGGAPGWADLVEEGRRRLSCHLCGGSWIAPRLRCPLCQTWEARDLVHLVGEEVEEGYFVDACRACGAYVKGVDRRQRWNAGSPVLADWGSPHLDVYASRQGYWRPTPSVAQLVRPGPP
jgi:hypothetical protein